jgi:hypothetical protein
MLAAIFLDELHAILRFTPRANCARRRIHFENADLSRLDVKSRGVLGFEAHFVSSDTEWQHRYLQH